jgi:hypothetical protein
VSFLYKRRDSGKNSFSFSLVRRHKAAEAGIKPDEANMGRDGFELNIL